MLTKVLPSQTSASILDQAVVSGGNFLTALVLARILAPADYGTFSLLFLSLFAINTCHSSLIVYPLTLRGAVVSGLELGEVAGAALVHTLLLALPLSALLAILTLALHRIDLWPYMAIAMLAWQLQETARRALLSALRFRDAILPDFFCYVGQALILLLFRPRHLVAIFIIVAVTSIIAALWQFALVRVSGLRSLSVDHGLYSWRMGRFVLAGNALNMLTLQIPSWTLVIVASPLAVAQYQALLNLVGVANPVIFSVNSLLIPVIAREAANGIQKARKSALHYGIRYGLLLLPPFLALFLAPHSIMKFVYGAPSPYLAFAPLLRFLVIAFAVQYLATVVGAYEGGMSRPKTYMWVQVMGTGVLFTFGVLLIYCYGLSGAVAAMVIASSVRFLTCLYLAWSADHVLNLPNALMEPYS